VKQADPRAFDSWDESKLFANDVFGGDMVLIQQRTKEASCRLTRNTSYELAVILVTSTFCSPYWAHWVWLCALMCFAGRSKDV